MGLISVNSGDAVLAGETIVQIQDTYGTANNGVREASIGVKTAQLSQENSLASLDQAVESARIAYEKLKKDYDAAVLKPSKDSTSISKAKLDLENYITAQEKNPRIWNKLLKSAPDFSIISPMSSILLIQL